MTVINALVNSIRKVAPPERLPVSMGGWTGQLGGMGTAGPLAQLQSLTTVGWLFAVVDRIATAVAATEWQLYRKQPNGERKEILQHPLLKLWRGVNPFYSQEEFLEASQQHFELTGEMWWVLLRNGMGAPVEIWPVRPDRMRPVPSRESYIAGYIYRLGADAVPLAREDVIFIRRPSPIDPYRGIGTVQAIFPDLQAEQQTAQWTRNFFQNSALPGGIIEVDEAMNDTDFERFVSRWREQHQGTANAHRVAVLERAKWVDRKLTQRDMQFEQLRKLNRDIILGAFGVPLSVMGVTESVNRANAEAGDVTFSKWVIQPRLRRIRGVINERLVPLFGSDLEMDFTDPTPENRELNLDEAERGYKAGFLTQNEARARLGEGAMPEGDEFFVPLPSGAGMKLIKAPDNPLHPDEVNEEEDSMEAKWARRLKAEAKGIVEYVGEL